MTISNLKYEFILKIQCLRDREQTALIIKISLLMLFREAVCVYCVKNTKHVNTLCGQKQRVWMVNLVVHIVTTELKGVNEGTFS